MTNSSTYCSLIEMNIAIIGAGYWGPNLIRNFNNHPGFNIKYVYDLDISRCKKITSLYPAIIIPNSFDEILNDIEIKVVVIATPAKTHFLLGKQALMHNKHVLIEKPITLLLADAIELRKLAEEKNLILMCDHTFCYHPVVQYIKKYISENNEKIGDFLYIDSIRINLGLFQSDINVIWDLAPHDLSIFLYLFDNLKIEAISAHSTDLTKTGFESVAYLTLFLEDNKLFHIHLNWLSPMKVRSMIIAFKKQMLVWNDNDPNEKLRIYDKGIDIDETLRDKLLISYRNEGISIPKIDNIESLYSMVDDFYNIIINRDHKLSSNLNLSIEVVNLIETAIKSMNNNGNKTSFIKKY